MTTKTRMKLKFVILLTIFIGFASCKKGNEAFTTISVVELKNTLQSNKNIQLVDVRTARECASGTIKNAKEIDVTLANFEQVVAKSLDKNKPVYLYCRSGGRSRIASKILAEKGYKVYNIDGGYMSWLDLE